MKNEDARICAICGRVLENWSNKGKHFYRHAMVDQPEDHPPVAVRAEDAPHQVRYRCDFCLREPVTHTLVADREVRMDIANIVWDTEWAMCADCTPLALADDWVGLRRRVFAMHEAEYGSLSPETKTEMRVAFRDLRASVVMFYVEP